LDRLNATDIFRNELQRRGLGGEGGVLTNIRSLGWAVRPHNLKKEILEGRVLI